MNAGEEKLVLHHAGNRSIGSIVLLLAAFLVGEIFIFASRGNAESEFVQSPAHFEKAIRNTSTSTYIVLVTIVNDKTGEALAECMPAPFLRGAIHSQYDLKYDASSAEKAIQIALANPFRVFHFSKQAAIDLVSSFAGDHRLRYQKACALVRRGQSVFLTDRAGLIRTDP
jgi:hypothetical protein